MILGSIIRHCCTMVVRWQICALTTPRIRNTAKSPLRNYKDVFSQYATAFEISVNPAEWKVSKGASKLKIKVLGADRISTVLFCDRIAKRIQVKLYKSHLGKERPVMGNIEPLLAITKPAEGLNKPCQGNVNGRKSFAAEGLNVKIPFISQTYTKAVAISFRQSQTRTRNFVKYHPRVVFTESFHAMVSTDEEVCSPCEREFDRHCKVQEKRHRDREPSRLPIKKIVSSMKKSKARRKLERIFRKFTPKSSSFFKFSDWL